MSIGSGPATIADARAIGAYFDSLIAEPSWLLRRVETIRILDDARVERSVTLDIDVSAVRRRRGARRAEHAGSLPIPIAVLTKDLLFELDVRDASGASVHVAVSDADSHASHAMLLHRLRELGISASALNPVLRDELYSLVRFPSVPRLVALLRQAFPDDATSSDDQKGEEFDPWVAPGNLETWRRALIDAEFFDVLATFSESYMLIGFVPASEGTHLIKVRHVEPSIVRTRPFNLAHLGLAPLRVWLQVPGVGSAQREHLRVLAPTGASVQDIELLHDGIPLEESLYVKRLSLERGIVYTRGLRRGAFELAVKLNMRRGGLLLPAAISTAFMLLLLGCGTYLEGADQRLSSGDASADAAVTILALIPTLGSIYFIQPGEHDLVKRILGVPRIAVVVSSLTSLLVAAGVAASVESGSLMVLLTGALAATALTFLLLAVTLIRISAQRRPAPSRGTPF